MLGTRGSTAKESSADAVLTLVAPEKSGDHLMTVRKLRSGPRGHQSYYSLRALSFGLDEDGEEITSCVVEFIPDPVSSRAPNAWKKLKDLKQALDIVLSRSRQGIPLGDGGQFVEALLLEAVRDEFYSAYPVTEGDQAKKQEARRRAFNRQLKRGRDADLICTREIDGEQFIWICTSRT